MVQVRAVVGTVAVGILLILCYQVAGVWVSELRLIERLRCDGVVPLMGEEKGKNRKMNLKKEIHTFML